MMNSRKFIHEFRTKAISELVTKKLNKQAALIVSALLKHSSQDKASGVPTSDPITIQTLLGSLSHIKIFNEKNVTDYLTILQEDEYYIPFVLNP
jgi:hypothetical protein